MKFDISQYSLDQLRDCKASVFREGGGTRPDVLLLHINGERMVLKDHAACDTWFALLIGPLLTWREARALRRLDRVSGIPNLLAQPSARALLMEYIDAEQAIKTGRQHDWPQWFESLEQLISRMHQAGIAHGDLRSPGNALVTENGQAVLVDFVASSGRGRPFNVVANAVFKALCRVDESAVLKLKQKIAPDIYGAGANTHIGGRAGMALRGLGQGVRKVSRYLFTSKS